MMTLQEYLNSEQISGFEFSKRIGITQSTVSRWLNNLTYPTPVAMERIFQETNGQVTANDFMAVRLSKKELAK